MGVSLHLAKGLFVALLLAQPALLLGQLTISTESPLPAGTVGTAYSQALAATGGTGALTWAMATGSELPAGLTISAAGVISGTPTTAGAFNFIIQVTDSATPTPASATKAFALTINPAALTITTASPLPNGTVGTAYSQALAATGGTGALTWAMATGSELPAGLTISTAGVISGTPTTAGAFNFIIQVTDSATPTPASATKAFALTINPAALTITTTNLPAATVGSFYQQTLAATGGTGARTWSLASGTLPPGLGPISAAGAISGTPTTAGTFNFTVQVTDSATPIPATDTKQLSIVVQPEALVITTTSLPAAAVGVLYSETLTASGGTGARTWSLAAGSGPLPAGITIAPTTGVISGTPSAAGQFPITVQVTDSAAPPVSATRQLTLVVNVATLSITTTSPLPTATAGAAYSATFVATGGVGAYTWSLAQGSNPLPAGLSLNPATGVLSGTPTTAGDYTFTIRVVDSASPPNETSKVFTLAVNPTPLSITTVSPLPNGTVGTAYSQTFAAAGGTGALTWSVATGSTLPAGLQLSAAGVLSGTPTASGAFNFTIQVQDSSTPPVTTTKQFALTIGVAPLAITTVSPLPAGTVGVAYSQTFAATGGVPGYTFSVTAGALPPGLTLLANGTLSGTPNTNGSYNFTVEVRDSTAASATKAFTVQVNPPALTITTASLPEATTGAAYNQTLAATGGTGARTWSLAAGSGPLPAGLTLAATTGVISGTPTQAGQFPINVQVTDSATPPATATRAYTLVVNLAALTITTTSPLSAATVGTAYNTTVAASGGLSPYTWGLAAGSNPLPGGLNLAPATGVLSGTPTTAGTYTFTLQVTDSATPANQTTKQFTLVVDPAPLTITTASPLAAGTVGTAYSQTLAATGGTGNRTWSVNPGSTLPAGLQLSAAGVLSGTPTTAGNFTFTIRVEDSAAPPVVATKQFTLAINPAALAITTATLPDGTVGAAYSQNLAATGGATPYNWSITTGSVPAGLTLLADGQLSGTPTTPGQYTFTARVSSADGQNASRQYTVNIVAGLSITTATDLPSGERAAAYNQTLAAAGGTPPYTWSVNPGSSLPAGLALNPATGVLSGSPAAAGAFSFTIRVTDSAQAQATKVFNLTVTEPLTITTASPLPAGSVGAAYSQTLAAAGGTPGYAFFVSAGALPPGLTLFGTGLLSGTPLNAGNFNFSVEVRDSALRTATKAFAILINPPALTITTTSLPDGRVGTAYSQGFAATGGTAPYSWDISVGTLPAGLAFSGSGILSGTPTTAGASTFTVRVTDSEQRTATQQITLTILPADLAITTPSLPQGVVSSPYSQNLQGSGGTPPYTWSLASGSLPSGLTLSAAGVISGSPTAAGTSNFTVRLRDNAGQEVTRAYNLVITPPVLAVLTSSPLPMANVGNPYNQTLTATGGVPPYSGWTVAAGSLPPGVSLAAPTGLLSGVPTAPGGYVFTVRVSDSTGQTAQKDFLLQVGQGIEITTPSALPGAVVGVAYSQGLAAEGGVPAYAWSVTSGALPPGITLNVNTGVLSGIPTTAGTFVFGIRATDSQGVFGARNFTLDVTAGMTITTPTVLPGGTVGQGYSNTLVVTGGAAPYSWALAGGALPPGINLSLNGVVVGTPTAAGTFRFTARATDATSRTVTKEFELTIQLPSTLEIITSSLPEGRVGVAYSQTLTASGGSGALTWSLTAGALPAGISLSPGGVLSGTPSSAGQSQFTVQVRDASGNTATRVLGLLVQAGPSITTGATLPRGVVGLAYSQQLTAEGGQTPYAWRLAQGSSLPAGLTLDPNGMLRGAPGVAGSFTFTVTVTDSAGQTSSQAFTLTVIREIPPLSITGLPATAESAQQFTVGLTIPAGYPETLTGQLALEFQQDAVNASDDPAIQFSSGGRTVSFTIPANSLQAVFPATPLILQTGTVAGNIVVRLSELRLGGADVTPVSRPSQTTRVNRAAPVIRSASLTRTATGFEVRLVGFSNPRTLTQATFRFTGSSSGGLQTTQLDVALTDLATQWYSGATSRQYGSQFTLTVPFTISGPASALVSVSVTLTNAQGSSNTVSVNY